MQAAQMALLDDTCPPCFNCLLPAFTCSQYSECNQFNGKCDCPPGFGGDDCLQPGTNASHNSWALLTNSYQFADLWQMATIDLCAQVMSANAQKDGRESTAMYVRRTRPATNSCPKMKVACAIRTGRWSRKTTRCAMSQMSRSWKFWMGRSPRLHLRVMRIKRHAISNVSAAQYSLRYISNGRQSGLTRESLSTVL